MSDTPRTDHIYGEQAHKEGRVGHGAETLCRTLETENVKMRTQLLKMADWLAKVRAAALKGEKANRGRFDSLADAQKSDAANAEAMERHCREAAR